MIPIKHPRAIVLAALAIFQAAAMAAPTVTIISPAPGNTVSSLTSVSITFNEAVTGVDADDLLINAEVGQLVSGINAGPYVFTFAQPSPGTVTVDWAGDHGIVGQGGSGSFVSTGPWTYTLTDTIAPTVTQLTPAASSTVGTLTQVEVIFSEVVLGVDAADLTINGNPADSVTGSGFGPYVFTFVQPAAGTVNFAWAGGHGITDAAAAPNNFVGTGWSVTRSAAGPGSVVINEFLASNGTGLTDENADQEDWIELFNPGPNAVNLAGWALTNDPDNPGMWVFPSRNLNPNAYLIVYASGKNRKPGSGNLHTNFKLNENGGYLALSPPDFPRSVVSQFPPNYNPLGNPPVTDYPPQRTDYSYGPQTGGALRYFFPPKPNLANGTSALTAITPMVNASVSRGFFKEAFQLVLSCPDASATIRYTTDFSEPTASNGILYSGPITINTTKCLRAVASATGKVPSLPVTHSYIFLDQVLAQPNTPAGFPTDWGPNGSFPSGVVPADYEMDTDPVRVDPNNPGSAVDPVKQQRLKDGLRELAIVSVTIPMIDMFGTNGLYYATHVEDKAFGYKKCAVEMILPDGSTAFSTICGISGHGNASRTPVKNPKHGFQLKFKGDYGPGSLNYKMYEDSPVEDFDDIILRPDFNSSWRHWSDTSGNGNGAFQRTRATRLRDAFVKNTFRDMGDLASHHRFFHLFINGLYWGTYDFAEQPVDGFGASYLGGEKRDYDVIHEGQVRAGDSVVYNAMTGQPNTSTNALYDTMKGYLDITEFIDYMLLHFYIGHQDWGNIKNWYAIRRRSSALNPVQGKFMYIPWDDECTNLEPNVNRVSNTDVPSGLHTKLINHPQYRLDFADRVQKHLIAPNGALTSPAMVSRFQKWQAVMDKAIVGESCRWGDYRRDVHQYSEGAYVLYTRENQWLAECNRLVNSYYTDAARKGTLLSQLQNAVPGLYPPVAAPEYRQNTTGGPIVGTSQVNAGFVLAMNRPGGAGTIYFTTDGNDPHIYYTATTGATAASVAATAQVYTTPLTINATTTFKMRILNAGVWSALNEATFTIGTTGAPVRITEIMYNPPGGTPYEFLELQNIGAQPVDLSGWYFQGIDFVFPLGMLLGAGDRVVLGNNDGATGLFAAQYPGVSVSGYFAGSLDNGGERIALLDAMGRTVTSVEYDDVAPWPTTPDGGGYSLEVIDPNGDPDSPLNWKASNGLKGTPGQANSAPASSALVINEVLAYNTSVPVGGQPFDYIELKNTGGAPIDLLGWTVNVGLGYTFTSSTVVASGEFFVLPCSASAGGAHLPVSLANTAGFVQLKNPGGAQVDAISYGNQLPNLAIGRVGGAWALTTPTVGADNSAAPLATAAGNLAINEWLPNPVPGFADWLEVFNRHTTLPVALQGLYFRTDTQFYRYPSLSFVGPLGYLQLFCDEKPGANQLDFKLPSTGTALSILDAAGVAFETVASADFGGPSQGVSRGRMPDGTSTFANFPGSSSPGASNYLASSYSGPLFNEVLARNVAGDVAPWNGHSGWFELRNPGVASFDAGGMRVGVTNDFSSAWAIPAGTSINAGDVLAVWCESLQLPSVAPGANLNSGLTLGDQSGMLFLFNSAGQVVDFIQWGFQIADRSIGVDAGTWKLLASRTRGAANSGPAALGVVTQLRINEWAAALSAQTDWLELYNLDALPVAMAGLYLSDDPSELGRKKFQIPALSFIEGKGWVKWEADNQPGAGSNHVNFSLDAEAEYLRLSNNDANVTVIDAVSFGAQSTTATQGRILDGQTIQSGLAPTPGAANILPPAPSITMHPDSQTVTQGANVSFMVAASGSAPLTYQWKFGSTELGGQTSATLNLSGVTSANDGDYTCIVRNTAGTATTNVAKLVVQLNFAQWSALRGVSGASNDDDLDGLSNASEFFHNLDPLTPASAADRAALPLVGIEPPTGTPQYITLTYRINARALLTSIEHQISPTLGGGTWSTVTPDVTENLTADPMTGDPRVRVKFSIVPGETKKYLRLFLTP